VLDFLSRPERHRYGSHRWARADLHVPRGAGPFPVVVLLHGGYWRARYSKRLMKAAAADLARRGVAAWNVEYRRIGRGQGGGWPATFDDVGAAIDHLATLDDPRLDLAPGVAAIGHSAGGQLALWSASRGDAVVPVVRVVAQAAVCNLVTAGEPAWDLLGGRPDEVPERYDAADPMRLVPLGVPTLLVHGAEDETVPVERSRAYAAAARAAGDEVTLIEPVPGGHRIHPDPRSEAWRVAAEWVVRPVHSAA
jgi:acetyl esterase/lipase